MKTIFKCPSMKPCVAASIDAVSASIRKVQPATKNLAIHDISAKKLVAIISTIPPDFQTNLTRVRGSFALSESYEDTQIDANSLVRDRREWLRVCVDAFCCAVLHVENISARY